jgi:hypothetical protein
MANDTPQHQAIIENEANIKDNSASNNNTNVITALVKFEKGDSVKARFTF